MGKTIRFNPEEHKPSNPADLIARDWKYKKQNKVNKNELSSKNRHGHFTKLHIWPIRNENKKGHKI